MLKKLRRKIIVMNMVMVGLVLFAAVSLVCAYNIKIVTGELFDSLRHALFASAEHAAPQIQLGEQEHPKKLHIEIPHVYATLSNDGIWTVNKDPSVSVYEESLMQTLAHISETRDPKGLLIKQRLAFVCRETDNGLRVVLGDTTLIRTAACQNVLSSLIIFSVGMSICFFISLALARTAVEPVETAWEKQNQFIADASHELKTPLTVILANHNIIASHPEETVAQQAQWLRATAEEAEQMRQLIEAMLMLAKSEEDDSAILIMDTDVSALVEEEVLVWEPVAFEANVPLETNIQADIRLGSDPALLKKLVTILIDNAVKHGSPGKPVTITLTGGKLLRLSVHNYGTPIPPEDLPHVFDRFYRSDKSRSTEGFGLGLAIAHSIVTKLQGTLHVTSSQSEGTTFTATFKC